ncbi:hypothetical protein F4775DRAFT_551324 [Biscogniauxia sp. FL1348]|nr:hypothetical protein F4775DRAFT_551324 [Biscogniauxia sp. FL1348]
MQTTVMMNTATMIMMIPGIILLYVYYPLFTSSPLGLLRMGWDRMGNRIHVEFIFFSSFYSLGLGSCLFYEILMKTE